VLAFCTHSIRIRAERRTGELLRETEKAKGARGNPKGRGGRIVQSNSATTQPTLKDHGISKDQSSDWQKLAAIPPLLKDIRIGRKPGA
jgi:hypothetical protein